jgi:hypothetical protein
VAVLMKSDDSIAFLLIDEPVYKLYELQWSRSDDASLVDVPDMAGDGSLPAEMDSE